MTKRFLIFVFALVCATGLAAQGYTPETVPNVQLRDARAFVSDPDGILSAAAVAEIDRMCFDLKQRQLAEVAVLVLDRVDDASLDMFAHNVLNRWGVGRKGKDNGLVISVVRQQRDIRFETGYGLEGVLPDALCKRIQMVYMVGPLGEGDWDKGVLDGVKAVYNILTDNQEELGALHAYDDEGNLLVNGVAFLMVVGVIVLIVRLVARLTGRGKRGGGGSSGRGSGGELGSFLAGMLLGGMGRGGGFGGGFGSGGSFGGGFGGGRSGGGGARTGF